MGSNPFGLIFFPIYPCRETQASYGIDSFWVLLLAETAFIYLALKNPFWYAQLAISVQSIQPTPARMRDIVYYTFYMNKIIDTTIIDRSKYHLRIISTTHPWSYRLIAITTIIGMV